MSCHEPPSTPPPPPKKTLQKYKVILDWILYQKKKRKKKGAKKDVVGTLAKFEYGLLAIISISIVSLLNFVNLILYCVI